MKEKFAKYKSKTLKTTFKKSDLNQEIEIDKQENDDEEESFFEAEGETYHKGKKIGAGDYSEGRKFKSNVDKNQAVVVLTPINKEKYDKKEVQAKYVFFKTLYPDKTVELFSTEDSYRLVLPLVPGKAYKRCPINDEKELIGLFQSAAGALQDCHKEKLVIVDFNENNIFYDKQTGKSYLIDGGMSALDGEKLHEQQFKLPKVAADAYIAMKKNQCPQYAPECFQKEGIPNASQAMDIYALGSMMERMKKKIPLEQQGKAGDKELGSLIKSCKESDPSKRPSLDQIQAKLLELEVKCNADEKDIIVNKNDEFFISLGTAENHSFIMLGVMQNGEPTLLGRVGKKMDRGLSEAEFYLKSIVSHAPSGLKKERSDLNGLDIGYSAYAINYNQYLEFRTLLSASPKSEKITMYQPEQVVGDMVLMREKALPKLDLNKDLKEKGHKIIKDSQKISLSNTCRHTAIALIEYAQGIKHLTDNVSRTYFRDLPLTIKFADNKPDPSQHFYVFPLPPNFYGKEDKAKYDILKTLYKRMEDVIKKDPNGDKAINNFEALKKLYCQQASLVSKVDKKQQIEDALQGIKDWKIEHSKIISELRNQSRIGKALGYKASTEEMVEKLEDSLSKKLR
jgi:serine/threonine protein kinase